MTFEIFNMHVMYDASLPQIFISGQSCPILALLSWCGMWMLTASLTNIFYDMNSIGLLHQSTIFIDPEDQIVVLY